jgi:hypothetical protein
VVGLAGLLMIGCVNAPPGVDDEGDLGVAEGAIQSENRLSLNRLSLNRLSLNGLSSSRLSDDGLSLESTELASSEGGRELLRYVVRCALREDQELAAASNGEEFLFKGLLGLAPKWLDRKLNHKEQRWISACLMAHVNGYGIQVPISLRGHHSALKTDENERATFASQEISYYGNVFVPEGDADDLGDWGPRMYACAGDHVQLSCGGSSATFGPLRACGGSPTCGVSFIGACRALSDDGLNACEKKEGFGFAKCLPYGKGKGGWPSGSYEEVITVYLKEDSFESLYPGCTP